jgi:hypothetical protein
VFVVADLNAYLDTFVAQRAEGVYECTECAKVCRTKTLSRRHVEANHVDVGLFSCDVQNCPYVSKNRHAMSMHKYRHHACSDYKL